MLKKFEKVWRPPLEKESFPAMFNCKGEEEMIPENYPIL